MKEAKYQFRERLDQVHASDRRDPDAAPRRGEWVFDDRWRIVFGRSASCLVRNAAYDLQDYFYTSMGIRVAVVEVERPGRNARVGGKVIVLVTRRESRAFGRGLKVPRCYRLVCRPDRVVVCGYDDRGVAQGGFYLEDLMNLREAPILRETDVVREPLFSPRMVHSGWGFDRFPDSHLNAMAHHGFDAVLVFVRGVDETPVGPLDFNDLIDRAASFGLDVYFYSMLPSTMHPSDSGAEAHYRATYGALFRKCPRARGIVLVGEAVEFPSRDPRTTGRPYNVPSPDGLPASKPSPGWWPCCDYPEWVNLVKRVIRSHNPQADVVFWTYNWGWAPKRDRLALIRSLPADISLLVTFEMFDQVRHGRATHVCVDYTLSNVGPGEYFRSEARAAKQRGIRLYTMCNTAGLTWDFGVIPYEPAPFQWARRHAALHESRRKWGLAGLMESHHYGWWPSVVSELAKGAFWSPPGPVDRRVRDLARRDYGREAAALVLKAWRRWSEAIGRDYIPTNEDQYGPLRVGPSYPLIFHPTFSRTFASKDLKIPCSPDARFGSRIVFSFYRPLDDPRQSPGPLRIGEEIKSLERMIECWQTGIECLEQAMPLVPQRKQKAAEDQLNLGRFVRNCMRTALHVKHWWRINQRLMVTDNARAASRVLDELEATARAEIVNAEDTIPLVERDSRLGWEPSMEYMTDSEHLQWKIRQVQSVLDTEIPAYRRALRPSSPA